LADNPGKSLSDLVAEKKINADQKASAEKKPALLAQIAQLEEQVAQFKKFSQEYEQRSAAEKAALKKAHEEELERVKEETLAEHTSTSTKKVQNDLLVLSKFLRAAAAKRMNGDEGSNENRAFEGALLQVYGGETPAVAAMEKLIFGADEQVPAVDAEPVDYTCTFQIATMESI
jgi:undecaprenyl pyrophosphate synthase